jgi:hypothetical protein
MNQTIIDAESSSIVHADLGSYPRKFNCSDIVDYESDDKSSLPKQPLI